MKNIFLLAVILSALLAGSPVRSAVLTEYTFTSGSTAASNVDPNAVASAFSAGTGIPSATFTSGWAQTPGSELPQSPATGLAEAITGNDYFSFTLNAAPGYALNLTQLTMGVAAYRASGASTSVRGNFYALSSINGFTTSALINTIETAQQNSPFTFVTFTIDLAGAAYQNLTSPVEFRIYMEYNTVSTARYLAIDDVVLSGTIAAIPEPSTGLLLLGSAGGLLWWRRATSSGSIKI